MCIHCGTVTINNDSLPSLSPGGWIWLLKVTETLETQSDRINISMSYFQGEYFAEGQMNRVEREN